MEKQAQRAIDVAPCALVAIAVFIAFVIAAPNIKLLTDFLVSAA